MSEEMTYRERLNLIRQGLAAKTTGPKPKKGLKQKSDKKLAEEKKAKEAGTDGALDLFFDAMLKRCTGKCLFCGGKTTAIDPKFYRNDNEKWSEEANDKKYEQEIERMKRASIAHLLPKRPVNKGGFPSVGTNEYNWIELCWPCHTSFDSGKITWLFIKDSKEWDIIKEKLLLVLPAIAEEERKHKLYSKLVSLVYDKVN